MFLIHLRRNTGNCWQKDMEMRKTGMSTWQKTFSMCQKMPGGVKFKTMPQARKLAKMNLAIRQLEANLGKHNADSFHDDQHKTLKANYIFCMASAYAASSESGRGRMRHGFSKRLFEFKYIK